MTEERTFTAAEKYQAILRELKYRRSVYPRLIAQGRMTEETAKREIEILTAIGQDYERELEQERLL
jgi:hypothetical protein